MQRNPGVRRLAANPLLLTILALMKRQGVTLPERRVELYQKYVETLLKHWNLARGLGRPPSRDLDVVETVRVLAPLALWMHETSPGVGLVKREAMRRKLDEIYAGRGVDEPERAARQFLADVREYAGLLLERGAGQYGFIHLTFQEYLAAVATPRRGTGRVEPCPWSWPGRRSPSSAPSWKPAASSPAIPTACAIPTAAPWSVYPGTTRGLTEWAGQGLPTGRTCRPNWPPPCGTGAGRCDCRPRPSGKRPLAAVMVGSTPGATVGREQVQLVEIRCQADIAGGSFFPGG